MAQHQNRAPKNRVRALRVSNFWVGAGRGVGGDCTGGRFGEGAGGGGEGQRGLAQNGLGPYFLGGQA